MNRTINLPKFLFFTFIIIAVIVIAGTHCSQSSSHAQAAIDESRIHYLSVPIVAEDTLSDIALEYYSDEFGSMSQYISRIKESNSLTTDAIYAGNHLIIPVYAHSDDVS